MNFVATLKKFLQENANVTYAVKQSDYMKNKFIFYGLQTPFRREILKNCITVFKPELKKDFRNICWELFQFEHREMHYCAIDIFISHIKKNWQEEDIALVEKLITTNSWWDTVDLIAKYGLGGYLQKYPEQKYTIIEKFSNSNNMWLNRSAIIFQLGYKEKTDFEILISECEKHKHSQEFFIQKAIGWALRDYATTNPHGVLSYVNSTNLKPLSRKEAIRKII
jgi:3-methyladenine DNA glycosylase AlkD